ncbi:uncharacterized protein V6R79_021815 [Siganus canaliculatus]
MANPGPVYYVGMQPGQDAVYPAPVKHGAAEHTQPPAPMLMPMPDRPAGCPHGLEYLTQIDQILVHQKAEAIFGWKKNNVYFVKNSLGQQVFEAKEENDFSTRQLMGSSRPFTIHLHDNSAREVLTVIRNFNCTCCQSFQALEVQSPPGNPIGYVEQNWHPFRAKFTILDSMRTPVLKIEGPSLACICMSDVIFDVMSLDGSTVVGEIRKEWRGLMEESFSTANHFGMSFPMDLDVKIKAVMIGACFLIDFIFFESKKD